MPVRLSIKIVGAELVRQGLRNLRGEVPRIGAQEMYAAMERARRAIVRYPPARGNYQRTGTYGRAWRVERTASGYTLRGQAVGRHGRDYTKYVGGDAYGGSQARVHRGRWTPVRDAIEKQVAALPKAIQRHIDMVARRIG